MPTRSLLVVLALVAGGCTHTHSLAGAPSRAEVNGRAPTVTATVALASGDTVRARSLHLALDVTTWTDEAGELRSAPTANVVSVRFQDPRRGAWEGAGLGLAVGVPVGVGIGAFWEFGERGLSGDPDRAALVGLAVGAAVASGLGALLGRARRSQTVYARPRPATR